MIRLALDDPRWMEFVTSCEAAEPFHHPAWAQTLQEMYRFPAFALAATDHSDTIVAGLPVVELRLPFGARRRWVSLPFSDICPPLFANDDGVDGFARQLEQAMPEGVRSFEVRSAVAGPSAYGRDAAVIHRLSLGPDHDALSASFRSKLRRNIRKAREQGVTVRLSTSMDDVATTFFDLHLRTRRRQGVPVQPRQFFRLVWRRLIDQGLGFVAIAEAEGRPLAAGVFLAWNGTLVHKYGASDETEWPFRPNHAILADVIEWGCRNGYHTFDFGRTDTDNKGLRSFKSEWRSQEDVLVYSRIGEPAADATPSSAAAFARPLIQRGPLWLGRGLGEVLYRYAG